MSRNRRFNWEARAKAEKLREPTEHGMHYFPTTLNGGFKLAYVKYQTVCDVCGDAIIAGERAWRRKSERWQHQHEQCRE